MENFQAQWPRGTVLGGCSSINILTFFRGARQDFQRWAEYTGDQTWDYDHVLSYFKKLENVTNPELRSSMYRGTDGPLSITRSIPVYPLSDKLINAFVETGYTFNEDYNGASLEGVARSQATIENGERTSTATAYIHPAIHRANLDVMINTTVTRLVIRDNKTVGVQLSRAGKSFQVNVTKEVVLSAGTFESPRLLMLSGIGPRKHLESLNISVVADLPVGENLQDHLIFDLVASLKKPVHMPNHLLNSDWVVAEYKRMRRGPLTVPDSGVAFHTSTSNETKALDWPDVKILFSLSPTYSYEMLVVGLEVFSFVSLGFGGFG